MKRKELPKDNPLTPLLITGNVLANNPHIEDCRDKSLRECKDGTALVLIDMQNFFLKRTGGYKDPPNAKKFEIALKEQQRALEVAMANNMPIVVVEYLWEGADPTIKPLADKLKNYKNKTTIKRQWMEFLTQAPMK